MGRDRLDRTRERVCIRPADRIDYEHLDRPVKGLQETIVVGAGTTGGSNLTYTGRYHPRGLEDHLRATPLGRPAIHRVMRAHFPAVRDGAEARASRSRVFATEWSRH